MMKSYLFGLLLCLSQYLMASVPQNILFIGNSITYFNDMPLMFESLANDKGHNVSVTMYAPGGTGFVNHFADPNVYALFRSRVWDAVVLQPGTNESVGRSFPISTTVQRGQQMLDSIYAFSPCAKVYLYEISNGIASSTGYANYFRIQDMIRDSTTKIADGMRVQMIPAGECCRAYYASSPNVLLHNSYGDIHPRANGSFLIASACFVGIFQEPITGTGFFSTIQQDTARKFFSIVDTVVLNNLARWRINTYNLHAGFGFSTSGETVSFQNTAANFVGLRWDFGDGITSSDENPVHVYAAPGNYPVTLWATAANGCVDSFTTEVTTVVSGTTALPNPNLVVFPNPTAGAIELLGIEGLEQLEFVLLNMLGVPVVQGQLDGLSNQMDLRQIPAGAYMLLIKEESGNLLQAIRLSKI